MVLRHNPRPSQPPVVEPVRAPKGPETSSRARACSAPWERAPRGSPDGVQERRESPRARLWIAWGDFWKREACLTVLDLDAGDERVGIDHAAVVERQQVGVHRGVTDLAADQRMARRDVLECRRVDGVTQRKVELP